MEIKLLKKRFKEIDSRLESLELNQKESSLQSVMQFLNSKPDELDEIFIFKLTLKQIRDLLNKCAKDNLNENHTQTERKMEGLSDETDVDTTLENSCKADCRSVRDANQNKGEQDD